MTVAILVGARPNFIKAAPLWRALREQTQLRPLLVHTGQHRQADMCRVFFEELGLPLPLSCAPPAEMPIAGGLVELSARIRSLLQAIRPDWVVVIGDVTSTAAGARAAWRLGIPLAHVEAGLRCGDLQMAEERNRISADHYSQLLFATEPSAVANLLDEGIEPSRIHWVGNVLVDALFQILPKAEQKNWVDVLHHRAYAEQSLQFFRRPADGYVLCTFHRAENVDCPSTLRRLVAALLVLSRYLPVVFPVHPRTEQKLRLWSLWTSLSRCPAVALLHPVGYSDMICLQKNARVILTDSGGVQEESTVLGVPCLTLRPSTERPITLWCGTNILLDKWHPLGVLKRVKQLDAHPPSASPRRPPLWDGRTAERIVRILLSVGKPRHLKPERKKEGVVSRP